MQSPVITFGFAAFVVVIVFLSISILINVNRLYKANSANRKPEIDWMDGVLIVGAILFILFSFFSPLIYTNQLNYFDFNYENTGSIGDTIGGLMNPYVALATVFVTGLAFYAQYKANRQIARQFKIQQFESQFYEMLRLHKTNVAEMEIEGYIFDYDENKHTVVNSKRNKITTNRKIFVTMVGELHSLYELCHLGMRNVKVPQGKDRHRFLLETAYGIFFEGLDYFRRVQIGGDYLKEILKEARSDHAKGVKTTKDGISMNFNYKPFSGHQSRLGHYYRHLFLTVRYVVKQCGLTYEEKRDYLRLLRAQLSNHEQILLYYNWLAGYGDNWEEKSPDKRKKKFGNFFFTDYRMLHNLNPKIILTDFPPEEIFDDNYRNFKYERGRILKDTLFEIIDVPNNQ